MRGDWIESVSRRIVPGSVRSILFALLCVVVAGLLQLVFHQLGATLLFVTFFPAVLIAALFAGPTAGAIAILGSVLVAWWAFIPPYYSLELPTITERTNVVLFIVSSALIVWLAKSYREVVADLRSRERERDLAMKELEHRGKNTFAVVEAIVRRTLDDAPERAEVIAGRIRAVSATNDLINRSSAHRVSLDSILQLEFEPYGKGRLVAKGEPVELEANTARNMALVIHELVTNAAKYGALSLPDGRALVDWKNNAGRVTLNWTERGGPAVTPPARFGFGSRLVTRTLKSLAGEIDANFEPAGLQCRLTFVNGAIQ